MNIMVVGGGGREHAIVSKLRENKSIDRLFILPGNGGMTQLGECVNIGTKDIDGITAFAKENAVDFAVIAPDDPLVLGAVDALHAEGIPCFGPDSRAAVIEGSKAFAKDMMKQFDIPTAGFETFSDMEKALSYLDTVKAPIVIKADGLALGKGVVIAETTEQAKAAVVSMMRDKQFGTSGSTVVIEEFLTGPEVSVLAFTDGKTVVPMVSSMDHKRAGDGDLGLNTGGMGTVAPNPYYTPDVARRCMDEIFLPTVNAMNALGRTFKGCLYFGLMLTQSGPKVIEYNCRFGDPETQVVLPLLKTDLLTVMQAVEQGRLSEINVEFYDRCACCVVMASSGYPQKYTTGHRITVDSDTGCELFFAGARRDGNGELVTSGGRVLGVVATGDTLVKAVEKAYAGVKKVHFDNAYCRSDIGSKALAAAEADSHEENK